MIKKLKQFYGPTYLIATIKIILTAGLFFTLIYVQNKLSTAYNGNGLPFIFSKFTCQFEVINNECSNFNIFALIFDFMFWYTAISYIFKFARKNKSLI